MKSATSCPSRQPEEHGSDSPSDSVARNNGRSVNPTSHGYGGAEMVQHLPVDPQWRTMEGEAVEPVPSAWYIRRELRPQIVAMQTQYYKKQLFQQLHFQLRRHKPIPGERTVYLDLTDPGATVPPEFLAFQLQQASRFEPTKYSLVQKASFEEIIQKPVVMDTSTDFDTDTCLKMAARIEYCSLVCVSGGGGMGKSTQLQKLALDWHSGTSHVLTRYELVLYISLTGSHKPKSSFVDILLDTNTFPKHWQQQRDALDQLDSFLKEYHNSDRVLVILDGYNRASQKVKAIQALIDGGEHSAFPQATVVVAGRPYFMKQLKRERIPDMKVDVVGITDEGVKMLFHKVLQKDEYVEELQGNCEKYMFDRAILRTPLFSFMICFLFLSHVVKDIHVCNHKTPMTTTELFHVILRIHLRLMGKEEVEFQKSPLLDKESKIDSDSRRLLLALGHLCYEGLKQNKYTFSKGDLSAYFLSPEELCSLGLVWCVSECDREGAGEEVVTYPSSEDADLSFVFGNLMFQEYLAGMYMASRPDIVDDMLQTCRDTSRAEKLSHDSGFGSFVSVSGERINKTKSKRPWYVKIFKFRRPTEHSTTDSGYKSKSVTNLPVLLNFYTPGPVEQDEDTGEVGSPPGDHHNQSHHHRPHTQTRLCLYNFLQPFQNATMFACGMNPEFTRSLLTTFGPHTKSKVCSNNHDKYDVGYEASLFSESFDPSLTREFCHYFVLHTDEKMGTQIQFPTPYDELVTSHMAFSFTREEAVSLLKAWYGVNLELVDLEGIKGGNIVRSSSQCLEMSDPCLFEAYLLHRFVFENITELCITGNYFPDFEHMQRSFPNLTTLVLNSVNLPTMKKYQTPEMESRPSLKWRQLHKIHVINCRASFPLKEKLLEVLSLVKDSLLHLHLSGVCDQSFSTELVSTLAQCKSLVAVQLCRAGLSFQDFYGTDTVSRVLGTLPNLTSVDLSENNIGSSVNSLAHALVGNGQIRRLSLSRCKIRTHAFAHLCDHLSKLSCLEELDLSGNDLGVNGSKLADSLRYCPSLHSLNLSHCGLDPHHFREMGPYMSLLTSLRELRLDENELGVEGNDLLLALPKQLCMLSLRRCGWRVEVARADLAHALADFRQLEKLDLQENALHGCGKELMIGLQDTSIAALNVRRCGLKPDDFYDMAKLFPRLSHLTDLILEINQVCSASQDCRERAVKYLCRCQRLRKLVVCRMIGEDFTDEHNRKLERKGRVEVVSFLGVSLC